MTMFYVLGVAQKMEVVEDGLMDKWTGNGFTAHEGHKYTLNGRGRDGREV